MSADEDGALSAASNASHREVELTDFCLLAYGLVALIAHQSDLPVIFIKGPMAAVQGLRAPRVSTDVDVLVDGIENAVTLRRELRARGWHRRPEALVGQIFGEHSFALYHPGWAIDIDLHFRYPGLGESAFAAMRDEAVAVRISDQQSVVAPSIVDHGLVLALHQLRSAAPGPDLQAIANKLSTVATARLVQQRARVLGAGVPAAPLLSAVGAHHEDGAGVGSVQAAAWGRDQRVQSDVRWLESIRREKSVIGRLVLLKLVAAPPSNVLRGHNLLSRSSASMTEEQIERWRRGVAKIRRAYRERNKI